MGRWTLEIILMLVGLSSRMQCPGCKRASTRVSDGLSRSEGVLMGQRGVLRDHGFAIGRDVCGAFVRTGVVVAVQRDAGTRTCPIGLRTTQAVGEVRTVQQVLLPFL